MKLLALLLPLGERLSGVMGGGLSSALSPGMKSSSRSVSLAPKMSMFVETLRWFLKLTSLISLRISVNSFMSRCWDIMDRINQSPNPRLDLRQILEVVELKKFCIQNVLVGSAKYSTVQLLPFAFRRESGSMIFEEEHQIINQ